MPNPISNVHNIRPQQTYGLTNSIYAAAQNPMVIPRHPQVTDFAFLGTLWIDPTDQSAWVLTAILANQAQWIPIGVIGDLGVDGAVVTDGAGNPSSVNGSTQWQVLFANPGASPAFGSLLPGTGIGFDETVPNQITISATNSLGVDGAVVTDGAGNPSSVNGSTRWQVLFANPGASPAFGSLLPGTGIVFDETVSNQITVSAANSYAFSIRSSGNLTNVTGDGTILNPVILDTPVINTGGCYNAATGEYTAPLGGNFFFGFTININGILPAHTAQIFIIYVNGVTAYNNLICNPANIAAFTGAGDVLMQYGSQIIPLNAGDIVTFGFQVSNGTKVINIVGTTYINGFKIN